VDDTVGREDPVIVDIARGRGEKGWEDLWDLDGTIAQ